MIRAAMLALLLVTPASARDLLLTIRTTPASIVECTALGLQHGYLSPVLAVACCDYRDPQAVTVILPPAAPAWMFEHELRHAFDGDYHNGLFFPIAK